MMSLVGEIGKHLPKPTKKVIKEGNLEFFNRRLCR